MAGGGIGVICALTSEAPKSSATTKSHSHKEVFRIPSGPEATSARALLRGLILVNELPQGERVAEKVRRASAMPIDVSSLIHIPPGGIWARLCRICDTPRPPIIFDTDQSGTAPERGSPYLVGQSRSREGPRQPK